MTGLAVAVVLSACGTSTPIASQPVAPSLLKESDLSKYPADSVQRTFFEYWSSLQFRSWADAVAYYSPAFRDSIGTASIIGAKKLNTASYPLLRPAITRVSSDHGQTTVYYTVKLAEGSEELDSITWRKDEGNWQIIYDSRLDAELSQFAQNKAEIEANGSLPTDASQPPSPEALRAAEEAEQAQARFLQQALKTSTP